MDYARCIAGCYRLPAGIFSDDSIARDECACRNGGNWFQGQSTESLFSLLVAILLIPTPASSGSSASCREPFTDALHDVIKHMSSHVPRTYWFAEMLWFLWTRKIALRHAIQYRTGNTHQWHSQFCQQPPAKTLEGPITKRRGYKMALCKLSLSFGSSHLPYAPKTEVTNQG